MEGSASPTVTAGFFQSSYPEGAVLDGIKADNTRFQTNGRNSFIVITLDQSQVVKTVRAYTDEARNKTA